MNPVDIIAWSGAVFLAVASAVGVICTLAWCVVLVREAVTAFKRSKR